MNDETEKMQAWPAVTVAVCVRNGEETIGDCLSSLYRLDYPREKLSFLVVDNGSTDATPDIVSEFPVEMVREPVEGRGNARNRAWRSCRTPFIAFTDADCTVSNQWLKQLMPAFQNPLTAIAGGDIVTPGDDILARFYERRKIVSNREFAGDYPYSPPFLATANAVFKTDAIRDVGGFQTHYRVAEDADICWRIQAAGGALIRVPGGVVYHHHRTSVTGMFCQAVDYGHDGIHVFLELKPETRSWIWYGLYARWMFSLMKIPFSPFFATPFERRLPALDVIRYTGLIAGRIRAAWKFRKLIL